MKLPADTDVVVVERGNGYVPASLDDDPTSRVHQEPAVDAPEKCLRGYGVSDPRYSNAVGTTDELAVHAALAAGTDELPVKRVVRLRCGGEFIAVTLHSKQRQLGVQLLYSPTGPEELRQSGSRLRAHPARVTE